MTNMVTYLNTSDCFRIFKIQLKCYSVHITHRLKKEICIETKCKCTGVDLGNLGHRGNMDYF